ncbi:hypothetical protein ACFE04_026232 [Oxalis oulophora]
MSNCREAIRSCLSMNPVRYNTSSEVTETNTTILKSLKSFPKFELQGSEIVVKLTDPDSYTTLESGIMYEDVDLGNIKGQTLCYKNQQVSLNYNLYAHNGHIKSSNFDGTPTKLSTDLGAQANMQKTISVNPSGLSRWRKYQLQWFFSRRKLPRWCLSSPTDIFSGFAKALDGMKPEGKRRIILPPKVTSFGEYRVVDVTLYVVEKPGLVSDPSTDPNSSIAGELQILRSDAMQGWSLLWYKTLNNILSGNNFHVLLFLFHLVGINNFHSIEFDLCEGFGNCQTSQLQITSPQLGSEKRSLSTSIKIDIYQMLECHDS